MNQNQVIERKNNRLLLIVYDLVIYFILAVVFFFRYVWNKYPNAKGIALMYFVVLPLILTVFRLFLKIYKRIWRNPIPGSFARLILAEIITYVIFVSVCHMIKLVTHSSFPTLFNTSVLLVFDLFFVIVIRMMYYYLYQIAEEDYKISKYIKTIIERVGLVDFSSKEGGVLKIVLEPENRYREPINDVLAVFYRFDVKGRVVDVRRNNAGYINRTYRVETVTETNHKHTYILQRINTRVFKDPDGLMKNYLFVIDHLRDILKLPGQAEEDSVAVIKETREGGSYLRDIDGCWRVTRCYNNVYSLDIPDSVETFYNAGRAFGEFIKDMADVNPDDIVEVIPNFHNTESRYKDLIEAIEKDPRKRVSGVSKEIEFVISHKYLYDIITSKLRDGTIPRRVCHNDTNLNNILFDIDTHEPVAIIDLDTVMPSTPLYDFGDSMRIGTNTAKDDEKDLSKVSCNLEMFKAYARGWLESCGSILTSEELALLPYASLVITSEDGIRFLTDHINGDTYYNIYYPGQNLDRSRTQLKLVGDMEAKLPEIKKILKEIYEELGLDGNPYTYDFHNN